MTRVNDHGEMREFFEDGYGIDVGGVAGGSFKSTNATFAQNDAVEIGRASCRERV